MDTPTIIPQLIYSNPAAWYLGRFVRDRRLGLPQNTALRISQDIEANLVENRSANYRQRQAIDELHQIVMSRVNGDQLWHILCSWIELRIDVVEQVRYRRDRENILVALSDADRMWLAPRRDCTIPFDQPDYEAFSLAVDYLQSFVRETEQLRTRQTVSV